MTDDRYQLLPPLGEEALRELDWQCRADPDSLGVALQAFEGDGIERREHLGDDAAWAGTATGVQLL